MGIYSSNDVVNAIASAAKTLDARKDEINRLNVFPVPDGDTGTNMSLTLAMVVENLAALPIGSDNASRRQAITTGALMGARGNSGVITSQILRGLCEGYGDVEDFDLSAVDGAFNRAVEVAFNAVRKPVEGTILTVLRDSAAAAHKAARNKRLTLEEGLREIVSEAYASVERTPELLPVLKENGVVDAGGFGLAIFFDAFVSALTGSEKIGDELAYARPAAKVEIEQVNDWEGSQYLYCNEFLVRSDELDPSAALDYLQTLGDCELVVGSTPNFKVHVHSNTPDKVLAYFLQRGQVSEVHIHNMKLQSEERNARLAAEEQQEAKPIGFVAVAAGEGNAAILESLGVDCVVSGGQTMNPSTKDLLDAVNKVNADAVIILPNNKNIVMAAQQCVGLTEKQVIVVPTHSIPQGISAMMSVDTAEEDPQAILAAMTEAAAAVTTAQITYAARNSDFDGFAINEGDYLALLDGKLFGTERDITSLLTRLAALAAEREAAFVTLFYGEGVSQEEAEAAQALFTEACPETEISLLSGGQPVYYYTISIE